MPSHGQHSFLRTISHRRLSPDKSVSMPFHGQHSFLLSPLIRPYFIRISGPIFAGNSQNILKKALFRGFTRMFTVCSYLKILLKFSNLLSIRFDYTIIIRELHHWTRCQRQTQFPQGLLLLTLTPGLYVRKVYRILIVHFLTDWFNHRIWQLYLYLCHNSK